MDPLGELPRGVLCLSCRRNRFAVYAGVDTVSTAGLDETATALHGSKDLSTIKVGAAPSSDDDASTAISSEAESVEMVRINASTLAGSTCSIVVSLDSSIADLKKLLQTSLGFEWYEQQLVCALDVLHPNTALVRDFPSVAGATCIPDILVLKIFNKWTRAEKIRMECAGCEGVNGTYTRVNTNCYAKDDDQSIRIFRYEADPAWPAAWYIEKDRRHGVYFAVPDQTLTELEEGDAENQNLGFPLPIGGWEPWTGMLSQPGESPMPCMTPIA
jgi:hypothetical protein